jgi:hypothetical protein
MADLSTLFNGMSGLLSPNMPGLTKAAMYAAAMRERDKLPSPMGMPDEVLPDVSGAPNVFEQIDSNAGLADYTPPVGEEVYGEVGSRGGSKPSGKEMKLPAGLQNLSPQAQMFALSRMFAPPPPMPAFDAPAMLPITPPLVPTSPQVASLQMQPVRNDSLAIAQHLPSLFFDPMRA